MVRGLSTGWDLLGIALAHAVLHPGRGGMIPTSFSPEESPTVGERVAYLPSDQTPSLVST